MTKYAILGYCDHTDGNAYLSDIEHANTINGAMKRAYKMSIRNDHACVVTDDNYIAEPPLTFKEVAPSALILEMGTYFEL